MFLEVLKKSCIKAIVEGEMDLIVFAGEAHSATSHLLHKDSCEAAINSLVEAGEVFKIIVEKDSLGGLCGESSFDAYCCELVFKPTPSGDIFPLSYKVSEDEYNAQDALDYFSVFLTINGLHSDAASDVIAV